MPLVYPSTKYITNTKGTHQYIYALMKSLVGSRGFLLYSPKKRNLVVTRQATIDTIDKNVSI